MDTQRLILFFIFAFSVFLLLDAWQRDQQPAPAVAPAKPGAQEGAKPPQPAGPPTPGEKLAATQGAVPPATPRVTPQGALVTVETDYLVAEVDTHGGDLRRLELKHHRDTLDRKKRFVLFERGPDHVYAAQAGLIGGNLPNHRTVFTLERTAYDLPDGADQVEVGLVAPMVDGVVVRKVFRFHRASYLIDVGFEIANR
ncbi:MAG: membrane protein insertase YidC, partial [Betaproteobacteria bacterium]|nr:membrane protein insertase YidC [Betaproteobacteria bacterium]